MAKRTQSVIDQIIEAAEALNEETLAALLVTAQQLAEAANRGDSDDEGEDEEMDDEDDVPARKTKRTVKPAAKSAPKAAKAKAKATAKPAPKARTKADDDDAEMTYEDLAETARKLLQSDPAAYLKSKGMKSKADKQKALTDLVRRATSVKQKLSQLVKLAEKNDVEISFGRGRSTDDMRAQRVAAQLIAAEIKV